MINRRQIYSLTVLRGQRVLGQLAVHGCKKLAVDRAKAVATAYKNAVVVSVENQSGLIVAVIK